MKEKKGQVESAQVLLQEEGATGHEESGEREKAREKRG